MPDATSPRGSAFWHFLIKYAKSKKWRCCKNCRFSRKSLSYNVILLHISSRVHFLHMRCFSHPSVLSLPWNHFCHFTHFAIAEQSHMHIWGKLLPKLPPMILPWWKMALVCCCFSLQFLAWSPDPTAPVLVFIITKHIFLRSRASRKKPPRMS